MNKNADSDSSHVQTWMTAKSFVKFVYLVLRSLIIHIHTRLILNLFAYPGNVLNLEIIESYSCDCGSSSYCRTQCSLKR